jgi:hypothetical protein
MNFDRAFGRLIWFGAFVANFLVFSLAAFVIFENHQDVLSKAEKQAENYARVLEQDIGGFIRQIDITLHTVIEEMARHPAPGLMQSPAFLAFLGQQQAHIPDALGIRIADAEGRVVGVRAVTGLSGRALPTGRISSACAMSQGRGWSFPTPVRAQQPAADHRAGPPHQPCGWFVCRHGARGRGDHLFPPAFFGARPRQARQQRLMDEKHADRPLQRGRSRRGEQRQGDAFAAIARTARFRPAECRLSRPSGIDGVSRIYRFHRIAPHELFLLVGLADEEILAEWKGNAAIILGLVLLFSISSLIFARLTYAGWQKREADRARLDELNTALALRNQEAEAARQKSN